MKSSDHDSQGTATVLAYAAPTTTPSQASVASIHGIMHDYLGFEADPKSPALGRGASISRGDLARAWVGLPGSDQGFEPDSTHRAGSILNDRATISLGGATLGNGTVVERRSPNRDATVSRRRADEQGAATVWHKVMPRTDHADYASTVLPDAHDQPAPGAGSPAKVGCDEAQRLTAGMTAMPCPGDLFLGFRIVEELGRGAFGRVFLAHQGDLAGRLVALKVSAEHPGESRTLAQLQHTNIVPIFSAHQAPPLHAVCMPYFGRATLADLLSDVEGQPSLPDSGRAFLKTVGSRRSSGRSSLPMRSDLASSSLAQPEPATTPLAIARGESEFEPESEALRAIGKFSYVDAVLWMGSRIADGLAHAHGRGILHRDLKPANILMTDDGQPMILDFNLSEDLKQEVGASEASAGGTLRYMSPEHLERFLGGDVMVDARSDLFALGVMLFELLTGRHPFEVYSGHAMSVLKKMIDDRSAIPPQLRHHNPAITPAVESIVRHCLEPNTSRRYQSAADLHEDLERHLADLPLKHAAEPSVPERARKWVRRHPRIGSTSTVMIVAMVLLVILGSALVARGQRLVGLEATGELTRFRDEVTRLRILISHRADDRALRAEGETLAKNLLSQYHVLDDPQWSQRPAVLALSNEDQTQLRDEVAEVLLMLTQVTAADAAERTKGPERTELARSAQRFNKLAMASFGKGNEPQAFYVQQAALVRLVGQEAEADRLLAEANKLPLLTARDHYLAAATLAIQGDFDKALPLAEDATRLDPRHFWSYFILGVCHDHLDHPADMMASFTTCTALRPDFADAWLYRGLAQLKRVQPDQALADFDRAAKLRPDWYEPALCRALLHRDRGDHRKAENDLTRALDLGAPKSRIYFLRAAERRAVGDRRGADADEAEGMKQKPTDAPTWISRGNTKLNTNPEAALDDYANALKEEPKSFEALQISAYILSNLPGRDEDAVRMLDRVVDWHPGFVTARSSRGVKLAILGRREEALRDARESLWRDTSPATLYQVAGIYATTSKTQPEDRLEAYRLLASALRAGYGFDLIEIDHELDAIRDQPEFNALIDSARNQAKKRLPNLYSR